ncbi:MAG: GGDEF domain-containing protein, partial [Azonexus sp.]
MRISDGYHEISRTQNLTLHAQYDRQLRRLEKITRISDRYQKSLRELSSALEEAALSDTLTGLHNRRYL